MPSKLRIFAGLTLAAGVAVGYGARRWSYATASLHRRMAASHAALPVTHYDHAEVAMLPPVVQRYFHTALTAGQPLITGATVHHRGSFNMGTDNDLWLPFRSQQRIQINRPGFVWAAQIGLPLGLAIYVHDAYIAGEGVLHAALLGLLTVMRQQDTGPLAQGELMRYLAETAWYPTALLPSQGVRWTANDATSAYATLSDGPLTLTMLFRFNPDGLIDSVWAAARERTVGKHTEAAAWEGRWRTYTQRDGMVVPLEGEVVWLLPTGAKPYWRGRITTLNYTFAPAPHGPTEAA